jgi:hypothetical protein
MQEVVVQVLLVEIQVVDQPLDLVEMVGLEHSG